MGIKRHFGNKKSSFTKEAFCPSHEDGAPRLHGVVVPMVGVPACRQAGNRHEKLCIFGATGRSWTDMR